MEFIITWLIVWILIFSVFALGVFIGRKTANNKLQPHGEAPKVSTNEANDGYKIKR